MKGGKIMVALILAIIAVVCDVLGFFVPGLGIAGFVLAIIAFVIGGKAVKKDPTDTKSKVGKILGLIFMILGIVSIIIGIIAIIAVGSFFAAMM